MSCVLALTCTYITSDITSLLLLRHKHRSRRCSAVSPVIARSASVLSVLEDQPVTLPCLLLAGNPLPVRQWLHNYGLVRARTDGVWVFLGQDFDDPG